jgi:hypothetical protein
MPPEWETAQAQASYAQAQAQAQASYVAGSPVPLPLPPYAEAEASYVAAPGLVPLTLVKAKLVFAQSLNQNRSQALLEIGFPSPSEARTAAAPCTRGSRSST